MTISICADLNRSLYSRGSIYCCLGAIAVIVVSAIDRSIGLVGTEEYLSYGYHAELMMFAFSADWFTLALPILCTLPYATAFVDDVKSGFIKLYLPRVNTNAYIKSKLIVCGLTSGSVLCLGVLFAYGLLALIFGPMEIPQSLNETRHYYLQKIILMIATLFLSGTLWSLIGFVFSALTMNRYMAYASPFVLYYVLIILNERYFKKLYMLSPKEWLFPSSQWGGRFGVLIFLLELILIASLVFVLIAKRRLEDA